MKFDTSQESYKSLRAIITERTDRIVAWVGSGLSTAAGLPDWITLNERLQEALKSKIESLEGSEAVRLVPRAAAIRDQQDIWQAFQQLRQALGQTTWRATIREELRPSAVVPTPITYQYLWKLKVHGILNLNLDRLAAKAFVETWPGRLLIEFNGNDTGAHTHVLKSPRQFICNLHGQLDDWSSWVLTKSDLRGLLRDEAYRTFIKSCLMTKTVVFFGMSAEDGAVGGHLKALTDLGVDFGEHYWVTSRRDLETDRWAETIGLRLIRYDAPEGDHSALLEFFTDLLRFVPLDDAIAEPAFMGVCESEQGALPSCQELTKMDAETIRKALNRRATQILSEASAEAYQRYAAFSKEYDEAIYRAWYTSVKPGANILCGYQLNREAGHGAFGTVYDASAPGGYHAAVKVLHEEIRTNPDLLHSFRRGVRSMRILSEHNVDGMVAYREASEIPAFVVMDWVDGPSLGDMVKAKNIDDWATILRIGADIADIVRRGHLLPERVLHRDLRPSNVMLKGFYSSPEDWQVVVLDFDLSWHRGAFEKSVVHGSTLMGYLAPEQIQVSDGISTRHTAVDSFGLGMTLFFMISGRDPVPDEHLHRKWNEMITRAADQRACRTWCSVPKRFARLIQKATQNNQKDRWDMAQIQGELRRMLDAVRSPGLVQSAELAAEEVAARCEFTRQYIWNDDKSAAVVETASGIKLELQGDESQRVIRISLTCGLPGVRGKESVGKWIAPATEAAVHILEKAGWEIEHAEHKYASSRIRGCLSMPKVVSALDRTATTIDQATARLRFD